ncbi:MAG: formate dehydrogenase accessory sulfurtransferase FdhD [Thermodesulfobacteriota bacterium]
MPIDTEDPHVGMESVHSIRERGSAPRTIVEHAGFRYVDGTLSDTGISLAREVPYTLFVNDHEILSIATLPSYLAELFTGFLVSEGVLESPDEIEECDVDHGSKLVRFEIAVPEQRLEAVLRQGMLTSGCAGGMVYSVQTGVLPRTEPRVPLRLRCEAILDRMRELDRFPGIYKVTRGVHASSVATPEQTIIILEDLGRHNAVDKIVGYCFLNRVETSDKLLLTTGRVTSEVLTKAGRSKFPIVVSRSSASSMAVAMAENVRVDVVTYVRGNRFNYFSFGGAELLDNRPRP